MGIQNMHPCRKTCRWEKKKHLHFYFFLYATNLKQFFQESKALWARIPKSVIANNKLPDIAGDEVLCKLNKRFALSTFSIDSTLKICLCLIALKVGRLPGLDNIHWPNDRSRSPLKHSTSLLFFFLISVRLFACLVRI